MKVPEQTKISFLNWDTTKTFTFKIEFFGPKHNLYRVPQVFESMKTRGAISRKLIIGKELQ